MHCNFFFIRNLDFKQVTSVPSAQEAWNSVISTREAWDSVPLSARDARDSVPYTWNARDSVPVADLGGRPRRAPPLATKFFSISCSFRENLLKSYPGAPPWGLAPPWENPGSATVSHTLGMLRTVSQALKTQKKQKICTWAVPSAWDARDEPPGETFTT